MTGSENLLGTVVTLMNFGAAGVGVIVVLFVFFIVLRGKQTDPGMLDLSKMLLRYGIGFATVCGLLALVGPLLKPRPLEDPPEMLLSFSPNFASEKLPGPSITLPNGGQIGEGKPFLAQRGQVLVRMDDALKAVKDLKQAVQTLAVTATAAQRQADAAVDALTTQTSDTNGVAQAAQTQAVAASRKSQANTADITASVAEGNYSKLAAANRNLNVAAEESFNARSVAIRRATQ